MDTWRGVTALLTIALAASIAAGLLGLWPDVRGESSADRRDKARISSAMDDYLGLHYVNVTRVRLGYLPGRAMVKAQVFSNGRRYCLLAVERFGRRVDDEDVQRVACDL